MPTGKKQAVVIGATGQIGSEIAQALKDAGYKLDPTWLDSHHPDATDPKSYENLPDIIHFAAYLPGLNIRKPTEKLSDEDWERAIRINLTGAFLFARAVFPGMKKAGASSLFFLSSIFATHPYPETAAYAATKGALESFARALAVEWGQYDIRVNCLRVGHLPKPLKTSRTSPDLLEGVRRWTPSGNLVDAKDIAHLVLALADSPSVSGAVIDIDQAFMINRYPLSNETTV